MNDKLEILREDGPLLAVNKPAGMPTQSPRPPAVDLLVRDWIKREHDKSGRVYLGIPHRLDRPVSGVVLFARNSKAAARLAEQFANRQVAKTYWGVLEGTLPQRRGMLFDRLRNRPDSRLVEIADDDDGDEDTQEARLLYRILATFDSPGGAPRTLVEIELLTGRTHQIRVQFGSRNFPLVGDHLYGSAARLDPLIEGVESSRPILLHARRIALRHPIRYDEIRIAAPLPPYWPREAHEQDELEPA
jgi:23S rRNA pseudouridine1911/1915/1917 synthase